MKKHLFLFFTFLAIFCGCLTGCSKQQSSNNKKVIYTTFFPVTDLTKRIVGNKMEVKTIIKGNEEPHSFELKTNDMKDIAKADLIIYNGAGMENFIPALKDTVKKKNKFLDLSQGLKLLEAGKGIVKAHDRVNPHTWLSVKNAYEQLHTIYRKVASMDPNNEAYYKKNLKKAQSEFKSLDNQFEKTVAKFKGKDKYFVTSHAAFNYLARDYGFKQVAVTGISPDEEPSAKQLKKIADFVKKHHIKTIFFEGKATPKVAKTLAKNTHTKTDTIYTMENLTDDEAAMGYLKLMELNMKALMRSFNE